MATPTLRQGTIATAYIVPPRGETKYRFGVVYTPDEIIATSGNIDLVAISSSCYPDDPDHIPLPWHPEGQVMTGLRKPCSIALAFTDSIAKENVTPPWGYVPRTVLAEMLAGLKRKG